MKKHWKCDLKLIYIVIMLIMLILKKMLYLIILNSELEVDILKKSWKKYLLFMLD